MTQQQDAIILCKKMYEALSNYGFYPALTGGALYKDGHRKDVDIVIFRNRQQVKSFEIQSDLESLLAEMGFREFQHFGFVTKCKFNDLDVDLFNPETNIDFDNNSEYGEQKWQSQQQQIEQTASLTRFTVQLNTQKVKS